jgi:sulfopyruvate decarboxylase alpha subunit
MTRTAPQWPDDIFRELIDLDIRQVAYVPDAGHARLIQSCEAQDGMTMIPLTTEEEGIGVLAGAWLGGQRGVLLVQSSGIGNCINLLALPRVCRFPLLILATMRGQWGELNPWQVPMGQISGEVLRLAGVVVHQVDDAERVGETVAAAGRMAFSGPAATAVLISQRVIGAKAFGD